MDADPKSPLHVGHSSAFHAATCSPVLGGAADFNCESCNMRPTWGMARGKWWLTCDCWQTEPGRPDQVFVAWKKDRAKRIKANSVDTSPSNDNVNTKI